MNTLAWLSALPEDFTGEWDRQAVTLAMIERAGVPIVPGFALSAEAARQFFIQRSVRRKLAPLLADALATSSAGVPAVATHLRQAIRSSSLPPRLLAEIRQHTDALCGKSLYVNGHTQQFSVSWMGQRFIVTGSLENAITAVYASQATPSHLHSQVLKRDIRLTTCPLVIQLYRLNKLSGTISIEQGNGGDQNILHIHLDDGETSRVDLKSGLPLSESSPEHSLDAHTQQALVRAARKTKEALGDLPTLRWVGMGHTIQIAEVLPDSMPVRASSKHSGEVSGTLRIINGVEPRRAYTKNDVLLLQGISVQNAAQYNNAAGAMMTQSVPANVGQLLTLPVLSHLPERLAATLKEGQFVHFDCGRRYLNGVALPQAKAVRTITAISHLAEQPNLQHSDGLLLTRSHSLLDLLGVRAEHHHHEYGSVLADELLRLATSIAPATFFYQLHDLQGSGGSRFDSITRGQAGSRALLQAPAWLATEAIAIAEAVRRGANNLVPVLPPIHALGDVPAMLQSLRQAAPHPWLWENLWITVATPAIAITAAELIAVKPKGVAVDLSTLAQLVTGTDASSKAVGHLHQDEHTAVLQMLWFLLSSCKEAGVPTMVMSGDSTISKAVLEQVVHGHSQYVSTPVGSELKVGHSLEQLERQQEMQHWLHA